eukprot:TRINITY_DN319_c0_g1_i2.p1 TRINITY_DN319_c0_g1~~TRINITY_DN319_c0_g1_i2.p1  ORF type:complete len:283 (-),score=73.94 TRINITY_DN319_c0_g1_i2:661-1509(-)
MADVTALENRLKQVTARLEQVEKQLAAAGGAAAAPSSSSSGVSSAAGGAFVAAYDELVASTIDKYVTFSSSIDPIVKQQADLVKQAANAQRQFLQVASQSKKPGQNELAALLKGTSELMEKIADLRNKNRAHKMFNWLSAVSEGITAFGWVAVEPTPGPFVNEGRASSEFYSNKILMEFKTKEGGDLQRNWVGAWNGYLKELFNYIKQHHTTGVTWNAQGGDAPAVVLLPLLVVHLLLPLLVDPLPLMHLPHLALLPLKIEVLCSQKLILLKKDKKVVELKV